jgi:hypothetical protein
VPVNPLTIALPAALPLEDKYLASFKQKATPLMHRIALIRPSAQYAALD